MLKEYLELHNVFIEGFIDNQKTSKGISTLVDIKDKEFDYIFIFSPNYGHSIYEETIKVVDNKKVIFVEINQATMNYDFTCNLNNILLQEKEQKLFNYFEEKKESYNLKNEILLVGLSFIDINIKYLYLYLKKHTDIPVYIATNSLRDIDIFKSYGIDVVQYMSEEFIDLVFRCKVKIIDHSPINKEIIKCFEIGSTIQLWHGVTVKMLGAQTNYKVLNYDILLSTSQFVSDYSFTKIYNYKHIIHCGYPRNDVLYCDGIELINVDMKLLNEMKKDSLKYIIYMPTYRPLGFKESPIDYKKLNEFGKNNNIKFIIKMHPFIAEKTREGLDKYQDTNYSYDNLIIYPANMDIYPLLRYSNMLLADYSSVYFDYLFLNKPIVFFPYDYNEWKDSADGVMLDYFLYSPGDKCYDFDNMLNTILENLKTDKYESKRKVVFNKMFENKTKEASELIVNKIEELLFNVK